MAISVMLKPSSSNCNLKCEYCFYHSLAENRQDYSKGYMSLDTAKAVIDSALDFAKGSDVYFTFQGGEPLLSGADFYRAFTAYVKERNTLGANIHYCLQTNGTLITDELAELFKVNGFLVGVSLDGDRELNSYRLYPDGRESFDDVIKGIDALKKYNVTFNVLSVLTKKTAEGFRSAYKFFKQNDLKYLQFIPCLPPLKGDYDSSLYMNCEDYGNYLNRAFKLYYNGFMRNDYVSIRSFDNYIALANGNNAEQCGMNGCCSTQFVVEGDGTVYPCDFYCTDEWELGNINDMSFDELYHCERAVSFLKESFKLDDRCKACGYFSLCRGGGCKRNRQSLDYCEAYKSFFENNALKFRQMKGKI